MDETNVNPALADALPEAAPPARDFAAEAEALIEARPELRGKPLPAGVLCAALEENQPLLRAYLDHEQRETSAELERLPDKLVPKKAELIDSLRERLAAEAEAAPEEQSKEGAPSVGGELDPMRRIQNLPQNLQERFDRLPKTAQRALLNL